MNDKNMKSLLYVAINDELSSLPLVKFDNVWFIVSPTSSPSSFAMKNRALKDLCKAGTDNVDDEMNL